VEQGPASQSYGLQVAVLAGVPAVVLAQARKHLARLEKQQRADDPQLGLFDVPLAEEPEPEAEKPDALRERLDAVDPDSLTPREALALLYELKDL
jgi:DNA mismatch repair protein MutS